MHAYVLNRFSRVQLFATPWTVAHQAPLSMRFPWQEHRNKLHFQINITKFYKHHTRVKDPLKMQRKLVDVQVAEQKKSSLILFQV